MLAVPYPVAAYLILSDPYWTGNDPLAPDYLYVESPPVVGRAGDDPR